MIPLSPSPGHALTTLAVANVIAVCLVSGCGRSSVSGQQAVPAPDPAAAAPVASSDRTTPDAPGFSCPPEMSLVPGGEPTREQRARWSSWAGHPVGPIEPFCLDTRLVSIPEYSQCPKEAGCLPQEIERLKPDDLLSPAAERYERALPYCKHVGKRVPSLEEMMWAIAGGTEDRLYPWGDEPLDKTRAPAFDAADKQRLVDEVYVMCADEGLDKPSCEKSSNMKEIRAEAAFPWDDGFPPYSHPIGSMPAGVGRWGHLDLMRQTWVVFDTAEGKHDIVGRCGFLAAPHADGSVATFHSSECSQYWFNCPPCREGRHSSLNIRCASSPQVEE